MSVRILLLSMWLLVCGIEAVSARPVACQSLSCIREHIDNIDIKLSQLIFDRLDYVRQAGAIKRGTLPIHDAKREKAILQQVGRQAMRAGYPKDMLQAIFKAILYQSNRYERHRTMEAGYDK